MKYLNMQERVDFVNAVVDNATQDGIFIPALLDIYFRIQVLIDICGVDFDKIPQEDYARVAYEDFSQKYNMDECYDDQLYSLEDACKAEAKRRDDQMLAYLIMNKSSSADDLFRSVAGYLDKASEQIGDIDFEQILAALGKFDKIDSNAVAKEILKEKYVKPNEEVDTDGGEEQTDLPV